MQQTPQQWGLLWGPCFSEWGRPKLGYSNYRSRKVALLVTSNDGSLSARREGISFDHDGIDAYASAIAISFELAYAVNQSKQRIIFAQADVVARMQFRSALAHQDVPGADRFAAILLDATSLRITVPSVA
jgi:hypothetical protein